MKCPRLLVFALTTLMAWGCSDQRLVLPPGQDPNGFAEAVAARGRETRADESEPEPNPQADGVRTTIKAVGVCLMVPVYVVVAGLEILTHCQGFHYP